MSIKELAPTYYTRLREVIQEVDDADVLFNAGCGDGLYDSYLKKKAKRIVSLELNRGDVRIAASINPEDTVAYCVGSVKKIPFRSETFDWVICAEVLEHLKEDDSAVRELVRVLKKGGRLVVTVPSRDFPLVYDPINYVLNRFGKHLKIGAWSWGHERLYTASVLTDKFDLMVVRTEYLSYALVGLLENSYVNSFSQRLTKNDAKNQSKVRANIATIKRSVSYKPPKWLTKIRDFVIWTDSKIFSSSKTSVGIMQVFEKRSSG